MDKMFAATEADQNDVPAVDPAAMALALRQAEAHLGILAELGKLDFILQCAKDHADEALLAEFAPMRESAEGSLVVQAWRRAYAVPFV